jgi:hypothetical protein
MVDRTARQLSRPCSEDFEDRLILTDRHFNWEGRMAEGRAAWELIQAESPWGFWHRTAIANSCPSLRLYPAQAGGRAE